MKQDSVKVVLPTIGVDLGDRFSHVCELGLDGEVLERAVVPTTRRGLERKFDKLTPHQIVIETGTHANWVHDLLVDAGHRVVMADTRKTRLISANHRKCDQVDAEMLARLGRSDLALLAPVEVRPEHLRQDLTLVRARAALVESRTALVNSVRGLAKSAGHRLPKCSAESLHKQAIDASLEQALRPLMVVLEQISGQIKSYDKQIDELCEARYPQTRLLRQVKGVGPLTALYFVLMVGDPMRFKSTRSAGAYFGLVPRRDQSGGRDPQLRISKTGDRMGRVLLVQCAHRVLGPFGVDSDLRRFGLRMAAQGGKAAKKRAAVATARKLAVLLLSLLRTGEVYEPLRKTKKSKSS